MSSTSNGHRDVNNTIAIAIQLLQETATCPDKSFKVSGRMPDAGREGRGRGREGELNQTVELFLLLLLHRQRQEFLLEVGTFLPFLAKFYGKWTFNPNPNPNPNPKP